MDDISRLRQMLAGDDGQTARCADVYLKLVQRFLAKPPQSTIEFQHQQKLIRLIEASEIEFSPGEIEVESDKRGLVSVTMTCRGTNKSLTLLIEEDSSLHARLSGDGVDPIDDPIACDTGEMVRNLIVLCFGQMTTFPPWVVAHIVDPSVGPNYDF